MLLGNLSMFAPLGFFPALLWDGPGWRKALLTGVCSSLFVGRNSDINDLILNRLGALCGYWAFLLLRRLAPALPPDFDAKIGGFLNGCKI